MAADGTIWRIARLLRSSVLEAYLPPPLDPGVIEGAVDEAIAEAGATSGKDLGRVMKGVMSRLQGQSVDGRMVNELVRKKLGSG